MATTTDRADRRRALPLSEAGKGAILKIYAGAPHGLAYKHKDQLNADLLAFLNA